VIAVRHPANVDFVTADPSVMTEIAMKHTFRGLFRACSGGIGDADA
jgi:hypothetical protein